MNIRKLLSLLLALLLALTAVPAALAEEIEELVEPEPGAELEELEAPETIEEIVDETPADPLTPDAPEDEAYELPAIAEITDVFPVASRMLSEDEIHSLVDSGATGVLAYYDPTLEEGSAAENAYGSLPLSVAYVTSKTATMTVGSKATFGLGIYGGTAPYTIAIEPYWEGTAKRGTLSYPRTVSGSTTFTFTPKTAKDYIFLVQIIDARGRYIVFASDWFNAAGTKDASNIKTVKGKVRYLVKTLCTDDMTAWQKAKVLHDWLCVNAHYRYNSAGQPSSELSAHTPKGVLLQGSGVCQSYATAYAALLTEAGIPNIYAESTEDCHVWNLVWMNGRWYHVDVTWDSQYYNKYGRLSYTYFGKTDADFRKDHYWDTRVTSDTDNYDTILPTGTSSAGACLPNTITASNITLKASPTAQIVDINAKRQGEAKLSYTSSDSRFPVSSSGRITVPADTVGKSTITITAATAGTFITTTKDITLTVKKGSNKVTASSVALKKSPERRTIALNASCYGGAVMTYSSSNKKVKVNAEGFVIIPANFTGSATITIKAKATSVYNAASKKITVKVTK